MENHFLVFWHPDCSDHKVSDHPECPRRVDKSLALLQKHFPPCVFRESELISDENILLFHTSEYLDKLKLLFSRSESAKNRGLTGDKLYQRIDENTVVMPSTRNAVYRAAGSVINAIDEIFNEHSPTKSAFCCVRPPGHHAERGKASGFCFINNVGVGAKYAQARYGVTRVAVLDFDVHHGNGTEEGFTPDPTLFYGSTHERAIFPGTGPDPSPLVGEMAVRDIDRRIVNRHLRPRVSQTLKSIRADFRAKWTEIIAEMERFSPQFVIISAGFDAHLADPRAHCDLLEEDFSWATDAVTDACQRLHRASGVPVPVMSVLEGGYDVNSLTSSIVFHALALAKGTAPVPSVDSLSVSACDCGELGKFEGELDGEIVADSAPAAAESKIEP